MQKYTSWTKTMNPCQLLDDEGVAPASAMLLRTVWTGGEKRRAIRIHGLNILFESPSRRCEKKKRSMSSLTTALRSMALSTESEPILLDMSSHSSFFFHFHAALPHPCALANGDEQLMCFEELNQSWA